MVPVYKLTDVRLECIKNPAFIAKTNKLERLHNLNTQKIYLHRYLCTYSTKTFILIYFTVYTVQFIIVLAGVFKIFWLWKKKIKIKIWTVISKNTEMSLHISERMVVGLLLTLGTTHIPFSWHCPYTITGISSKYDSSRHARGGERKAFTRAWWYIHTSSRVIRCDIFTKIIVFQPHIMGPSLPSCFFLLTFLVHNVHSVPSYLFLEINIWPQN